MNNIALVLGCLAFTSHGRRASSSSVSVHNSPLVEEQSVSSVLPIADANLSWSKGLSTNGTLDPWKTLAAVFLAFNPTAAFNPAGQGKRLDYSSPTSSSLRPLVRRSRIGRPQLAPSTLQSAQVEEAQESQAIEFPPETGPVERANRALTFWLRASPIVLSYLRVYADFQVRERLLGQCLDSDECEVIWKEKHETGSTVLAKAFNDLKGFYVKVGQIIATREDLFPRQYSDALAGLTDFVDPMNASLARAVVKQELLNDDETFESMFAEFDDVPLGAASVAQVHRARLTEAYGGGEVAVKIQRPAIEAKLLGDVAALKNLAGLFRGLEALPIDYYVVFKELEEQLADEFDFVLEGAAMDRIGKILNTAPDGTPCTPAVVTPRPVAGLVTKRVIVMDYLKGVPLSRAVQEMKERGIDPESPEAKLFGRRLLSALTEAFGRTILENGFFHADPHPGNIFVLDDGRIGLIDFGQVKQISARAGVTLSKVMIALAERTSDTDPEQLDEISRLALELGVRLREGAPREGPAATAMWLFDGSVKTLPGGFDTAELSPNSPVKVLKSFPQDLTLVGRSTILIKGIASRLGVEWSLANQWEPIARRLLDRVTSERPNLTGRLRFRTVMKLLRQWGSGKMQAVAMRLPKSLRKRLAAAALRREERKAARKKRKEN